MHDSIIAIINVCAALHQIDPILVKSVAIVESGGNVAAIGTSGEVGLMQIMPQYSIFNIKQLKDPTININEGIFFLQRAKKECKHQAANSWLVCFNRGSAGGAKISNPFNDVYYKKVMKEYKKQRNFLQ